MIISTLKIGLFGIGLDIPQKKIRPAIKYGNGADPLNNNLTFSFKTVHDGYKTVAFYFYF